MSSEFTTKMISEWLHAQGIQATKPESVMVMKVLARLAPAFELSSGQ